MAEIDELLRSSFDRLAEPADSTGVADLIRARVAAGDSGTSADAPVAPGWAEPAGRPRWFWPLTGAVGVLVLILGILLAVLLWPGEAQPEPADSPTPVATPTPTPTVTPTPTPTPTTEPDDEPPPPAPPPPPPPEPKDTTAPTVQQVYANPPSNEIPCGPGSQTVIWALIADDTGVARARVSWTGTTSGSGEMTAASGMWQYAFTLPSDGAWTFAVTGSDAAGNTSAPLSANVSRICIY